jgi:cyclopropane-fatty-acyl-phospholipid synthase
MKFGLSTTSTSLISRNNGQGKTVAPENVVNFYDLAGITLLAGIQDYTEGIYDGDPSLPYDTAQNNQHNYLLDELGAGEGFRLLDVGCGLGTLLETAKERGVIGTGITISEDQVSKCRAKGLTVHLLNYKDLPNEFEKSFDGIIANGSLEHFCQPEEAMAGKQHSIYKHMFKAFARVLDSDSDSQRVVTTALHFREEHIDPRKFLRNPFLQIFNPEDFHSSILHRGYGGYYPIQGQLEACASGEFALIKEVEATEDYRFTVDHWRKKLKKASLTNVRFIRETLRHLLKRPIHTTWAIASYVGPESWLWQFRGDNPPAKLYRHTWQRNS